MNRTENRPGLWFSLAVIVGVAAVWVVIRTVVFHNVLLPLSYVLPLLVCVWTRRRWQLLAMAAVFCMAAVAEYVLLGASMDEALARHHWADLGATLLNVAIGTVAVYAIMAMHERDVAQRDELLRQNDEIKAQAQELARHQEELAQQNQELAEQQEEMQNQAEELEQQAEALQVANQELAWREETLQMLLNTSRALVSEDEVLRELCLHGRRLLGEQVAGAAVVEVRDGMLHMHSHDGVCTDSDVLTGWPLTRSLTGIALEAGRSGALEDMTLRPDLIFPTSAGPEPFRSVLAAPVWVSGRAIGAVEFYGTVARAWTEHEFRLAEWVAAQCSSALEAIRLRAEAERARGQIEAVFQAMADGVVVTDMTGKFVLVNEAEARINGYPNPAAMKRDVAYFASVYELRLPDGRILPPEEWPISRVLRGESVVDWELQGRRKDTDQQWYFSFSGEPVRNEKGEQILAVVVTRDITEMKAAEEQLRRTNEQLERRVAERTGELRRQSRYLDSFFEHALTPLVFLDPQFNFIRVNEAYARACGRKTGDFPGKNHFALYPHAENQAIFAEVVRSKQPHVAVAKAFEYPDHPEWGVSYWDWTLVPVLDAQGEVELLVFALEDVTARKRAELDMQEQNQWLEAAVQQRTAELEAASRAKDHFLAVLSHELRTPLTPVLMGVSEMLADPSLPPEVLEDLAMVRRNVELETRLIDDLLDVTRIARGKLELQKHPAELRRIVMHAAETCIAEARAKGLELELDLGDEELHVEADAARLQQVFWNLIKNAVKFTSAGKICVSCRGEDGSAVVCVADSGIGMEPHMVERIFTAFEQGGKDTTRQFGGLGLGLAITKALIEMHAGAVLAHSDGIGRGSVFTVRLPLIRAAAAAGAAGHPAPGAVSGGGRVLLVEDHADSARILARLLVRTGWYVKTAGDVATALRTARAERFDVVVSDIGLPDGTGLDLMRQLRLEQPRLRGIALSGHGLESDMRLSREAGFAAHLVKPVNPQALRQTIASVLDDTAPEPETRSTL